MPSSRDDLTALDARTEAQAAQQLVIARLIEQTIALSAVIQAANRAYAHRLACDIRGLAWSVGLAGSGATAAVLAQRLSDPWAEEEELMMALDAVFSEVHSAAVRTGGDR